MRFLNSKWLKWYMRCEIGIHKADWSFQEDKIQHRCLRKMIYYIGRWLLVVVWDFKSQLSVFQSIQLTLRSPNPKPFSFCDLGCSALFRDIFWLNGFVREILSWVIMSDILSVENNARLPVEKSAVNTACALLHFTFQTTFCIFVIRHHYSVECVRIIMWELYR